MKPKLPSLLCSALLAALLASGCDTPQGHHPRTTTEVDLVPDRPAPDVTLGLVSAVKVVLPGPEAGSGLIWEIISNNNRVLDQMGPMRTEPGPRPVTTVSFYALKPGKSVLRFFLVHPMEQEAVPVARCEVTVRVSE
jgi:hypothetical protein